MAINSQKLLPQAKLASTKVNVEKKNVLLKKELINIRKTLISIDKLLLSNSLFQRKATELKRKDTEKQRFKEKETRLEKKKEKEITKDNELSVPQLGIFDRINRFITFTFLGFLFNKFSKYLPQILEFSKKIQPIAQFIESFIGNVFNGIVNFIDFGYNAHKKVSNFAKQIGGENFQKTFDDFSGNLNKFINLAIVVGMATMGGTDFGLGKKGGKPGLGSNSFQKSTAAEQVKNARIRSIQKQYGPNARKIYENALNNGKTPEQAESAIKRGLKKGVSIRPGADSLAARTAKKGSLFKGGLGKAPGRIATRVLGKTGSKLVGKVFGRIPIIGGLVSFIISVLSGEPVGRAAAKAVGFSIGSALGTFIPIPFAGTILGGILGDIVGGALYDTIVGSKPDSKKVEGRNKGGPITRGRRKVRDVVKRTVRVTKSPPKVPPAKPGESIGGKKNLQKIFPEPVGQQKGKTVNPYGFLTDTANSLLGTDIAGALGSVFIKPFLGQLPTKEDYKNFGLAMNIWISNAMSKGLIGGNATGGFADGGIINNGMMGDISKWAEKSIEEMIKNKVTDAINDLRKNLGLESLSGTGDPVSPGDMGDAGNIIVSSDQPDFWLLATAALFEGISTQGYADVAQAIYNRVAMPGDPWKTGGSIRTAILNPTQFQPVREKGGVAAWSRITDKQSAIAYTQSQGRTQAQLETAASALLDTNRQRSAKTFVGPRDSFRSISYEDKNNHLADDTEVRREGHAFGFEPRGATIAAFRSGQLRPAEINRTIVSGSVSSGQLPLTGDNGRMKPSQLIKVGTLSSSPEGGPYWYGSGAYLRKSDAGPAFLNAKQAAAKEGIAFVINSAYRSLEHQKALQGKYAVVAAVGSSPHGEGIALDIQTGTRGWNWLKTNGPTYGWRWMAIPNDEVHFEYVGGVRITSPKQQPPGQVPTPTPQATGRPSTAEQLRGKIQTQTQKNWTPPKGSIPFIIPGKGTYYADMKSNKVYDSRGMIIDVSGGKNKFILEGLQNKKRTNPNLFKTSAAFKDGGSVGFDKKSKNIGPLQNFPSYDQGYTLAILPIETTKLVPIQSPSQNKIAFTGGGGGVNSNDNNRSRMFVG